MKNLISYLQTSDINSVIIHTLYIVCIILCSCLLGMIIGRVAISISDMKMSKNGKKKFKKKLPLNQEPLYKAILRIFIITGIFVGLLFCSLDTKTLAYIVKAYKILLIMMIASAVNALIQRNLFLIRPVQEKLKLGKDDTINKLLSKILRGIVDVIAAGLIISELGYDITGILAGLGLTSAVIAFAAQDTFKNFFGGFIILLDKPFLVGDWIQLTNVDIEGIVEDITFRSTRIRTFKDSLITIPNSNIVNESIINWSKMNTRRNTINLEVTLDTPIKSLNKAISDIQLMLLEHPDIDNEKMYIHFDDIKPNGYNLFICYFTKITTYSEFLQLKENINYKIVSILEKNKVKLAYNSQDIYIHPSPQS